jgi:mannose-6-phosphate isomerase-like protein (cupin superfamily)
MKYCSLGKLPVESVSHNPAIRKKVMLRTGELPHLTNFAQAEFAPGQIAAAHAHSDMCEVFFVASGSGTIVVNGTVFPLEVGTCIAIEAGETHEVSNTGSVPLVLTYFGIQV